MVFTIDKNLVLNDQDIKREKRIISKLNLKKLPFEITKDSFCSKYLEMFQDIKPLFKYYPGEYAMKWCLSTDKKMKVFLLIFEANEFGKEIYKEEIAKKLPEYSYKTIAQIVDQGVEKEFFVELNARATKKKDLKIRNIRPSEQLVIEFINWNIEVISVVANFQKKYK